MGGNHFAPEGPVTGNAAELQQLTQIIAKPKRGQCSKTKDNCLRTGCCATVGYTCFQTKADMGKCLKNCTPGATQMCTQPQFVMDPILQDAVPQSTSISSQCTHKTVARQSPTTRWTSSGSNMHARSASFSASSLMSSLTWMSRWGQA